MAALLLPHVRLAHRLGQFRQRLDAAYRSDRQILDRWPRLQKYAGIRVVEFLK